MYTNAIHAIDYYGKTISSGSAYLMQAMPKLLSVYYSLMGLQSLGGPVVSQRGIRVGEMLTQAQRTAAAKFQKFVGEIPASHWYSCMPQIVSRVGRSHPDVLQTAKGLLHVVLTQFPEHAIWHLAPLLHSMNMDRRNLGKVIIKEAAAALDKKRRHTSSVMLHESLLLFSNLVELAQSQPKERRIRWTIGTECALTNFLVPSLSALTICFPSHHELGRTLASSAYFPSDQV